MKLTRLEAKGFKSFGDKIILQFGQGVTGVVGPNGCGKSNIVDAIRWVLGEQKTRNLRSDKMENIIFNGTANRKPLQMAEVLLTFENTRNLLPTEYGNVTIGRRYHRSGESEYLLNGVSCRLKDIENLFMDTGIGPDSYAIIELKMVDEILADRDGSRRGLFEEAAGVSRFKQRKKETFRRLEDVQADLERVEDLLHEISRNLKSLERQARQAEKYFELKEKHKALALEQGRREHLQRQVELDRLNNQIESLQAEQAKLAAQALAKEGEIDQLKEQIRIHERQFGARQQAYLQLQEEIRKIENDRRLTDERTRAAQRRKDQLSQQVAMDSAALQRAEANLQRLNAEFEHLQEAAEAARIAFEESQQALDVLKETQSTKAKAVEEAVLHVRQKEDAFRQLQREQEISSAQHSTYCQEENRLKEKSQSQAQSYSDFDARLAQIQEAIGVAQQSLNTTVWQEEQRHEKEKLLQARLEQIREQVIALTRRRDADQNELNLTKSLQENLEGYPEAIRYLKKAHGWSRKSSPALLSDLISVPEKYRVALEFFLDPVMNHYVVETEAEALKAIELLGNNNRGKASFFVLENLEELPSTFEPHPPTPSPAGRGGEISAIELVEFDPIYKSLFSHLLGGAFFTEKATRPAESQVTLLSFDGRILHRKYSLAGGSIGLYEGKKIGRAKQVEKLQASISQLNKELKALETERDSNRAELEKVRGSNHTKEMDRMRRELSTLNQDNAVWQVRKEQAEKVILEEGERLSGLAENIARLEAMLAEKAPKLAEAAQALDTARQAQSLFQEDISALNKALETRRTEANQTQVASIHRQSSKEQNRKEAAFRMEEQTQLQHRLSANRQELDGIEAQLNMAIHAAGHASGRDLAEMQEELSDIDAGVKESAKAMADLRSQMEVAERDLKEFSRRKDQNASLAGEMQLQLGTVTARLEAVEDRIRTEFGLEVDELEADPAYSSLEDGEISRQTSSIRDQLERIGPINPVAMDSYKEMKQRHDFIQGQKEDLEKSRMGLTDTISEIDHEARKVFMATYEQIRTNFFAVFKSLFSEEDTCELLLTDPANPLESPIEIMARPKGKRPLTINQLSGGEKTLTAIALLFAIYLVKPAPFCIFDEVDAPLDDMNIDKFNNIIRDFSANSQFIVVTHNKRTMTHADILYGITMVEQGVSRVIPVDLRQEVIAEA